MTHTADSVVLWVITSLLTKFHQTPTSSLWEILLTNKQTNKQTNTRRWLQYPAFRGIKIDQLNFGSFYFHFLPQIGLCIWITNWKSSKMRYASYFSLKKWKINRKISFWTAVQRFSGNELHWTIVDQCSLSMRRQSEGNFETSWNMLQVS